ncbi:MAG: Ldh family oxidoreductase [Planctomycetota bacterium]|nr:Ldh family oxidoreductase [Planctomycetota bacterium]MDA1213480.1 Ldh family oxidoreductase [Planctomycetota bacterium]
MQLTPDYPRDAAQEVFVPADGLRQLIERVLVKKGMYAADAEIVAARMIEADLRGIHSHGSKALPVYLNEMDDGNIDPRGNVMTIKETPAIAVLDGGRAMGQVSATKAMNLAIEKARDVGTGTVSIRNGQHYGACSVYVLMAVKAGMIGYTTTSTGAATVAAYGSRQAANANHAMAWGVPVKSGAPVVLDMACAESSWGKIEALKMYNGKVPEGWGLDTNGEPTVDPHAVKVLTPTAGARGYGLAFMAGVLCSPLVGARMPLHKPPGIAVGGSEHFFQAIDLRQFTEEERYFDEVQKTVDEIRQLMPAEGFDRVRLPGEREWERSQEWIKTGIPFHRDHVEQVMACARQLKVEIPWV